MGFRDRHPGTIADALARPGTVISVRPDGAAGDQQHIWWLPDGRIITQGIGDIPTRSPYRVGQWVQIHGYPGETYRRQRHGMRGFILGGIGGSHYIGLTEDGHMWSETGGSLDPDGTANRSATTCVCCPHRERYRRRPARVEQLDLFDLLAVD